MRDAQIDRDGCWDVLRGIALLGVLGIHACGPYMTRPLAGLLWPVWEPTQPIRLGGIEFPLVDAIFWTCRGFAVPLFFFIAGFFAARSLVRADRRRFMTSRITRYGTPLVLGTLLVLPLMYFIWAAGWVHVGSTKPSSFLGLRHSRAIQPHLHGFAHLWYLAYALIYSLALSAIRPRVASLRHRPAVSAWMAPAIVVLGGVCVMVLPSAVIQFRNAHYPIPGFFLYHALFFVWGAIAFGQTPSQRTLGAGATAGILTLAVLLGCTTAVLIAPYQWLRPPQPLPPLPESTVRLAIGVCSTLQAVLIISTLARAMRSLPSSDLPSLRPLAYLGRNSLWIYMIHPAIVGAVALGLYFVGVPVGLKVMTTCIASLALPMMIAPIARRTWLGRSMGAGERAPDRRESAESPPAAQLAKPPIGCP